MQQITLEQIHKDLLNLKKDIEHIKMKVDEEFELADDVVRDIQESKKRSDDEFISHEDLRKEFQ